MLRPCHARLLATMALLAMTATSPTHAQTFTGTDSFTFADVVSAVVTKNSDSGSASAGNNDNSSDTGTTTSPPSATPKPSSSTTTAPKTPAPSKASSAAWRMKTVTSIQARVHSDEPFWDDDHGVYVSKFGSTFDEKYRGALDTVNTASVEGALMYVQAEGINVKEQSVKCERKNKMEYVVFYELQIAQTVNSVAQYQTSAPTLEYCPFVAMDSNRCTPTNGETLPKECDQFNGLNGEANLGPCVGGESKASDFRAPYPNTYWFSFPNSCPGTARSEKTDKCRAAQPGGLCPFGTAPDGLVCTYAYKILGYLKLDDLVGITALTNKATGAKFANLKEFCEAGGVEFDADQDGKTLSVNSALAFWKDPTSAKANQARFQKMVTLYNKMVKQNAETMAPLPSVADLTKANPKCYENNVQCASAASGCKRINYYQTCEVCTDASNAACVKAPKGFVFPKLVVDKDFKLDPSGTGGSSKFMDKSNATSSESSSGPMDEAGVLSGTENLDVDESPATKAPSPTPPSKKVASAAGAVRAPLQAVTGSVAMALVLVCAASL